MARSLQTLGIVPKAGANGGRSVGYLAYIPTEEFASTALRGCQIQLNWGMVKSIGCKVSMEIGQQVKVYRLRDRVSKEIIDKLGQTGTIKDFKMTDGSSVGAVVEFKDKTATWFFADELKPVE